MERRRIGRTGLEVTVLGFGCGPIGGLFDKVPDEQARQAVRAARDGGIGYFDVAPFYGIGLAEHRLGEAFRGRQKDFVLSTKVGRLLKPTGRVPESMLREGLPFEIVYDYSYDGIMRSVDDSCQRLGMAGADILYIHDVNRKWHGDAVEERFREVMEGGYKALDRLRSDGAVKAIGVGVNDPDILVRFAEEGDFDCFMLAGRYTLLEQTPLEKLFPVCEERDISIVSAGPFNSGIMATGATPGAKYFYADAAPEILERTRRIEKVCALHDVPLAAAALQFALGHPVVASVATGMVSPREVETNLRHMAHAIPDDFWLELKQEGLLRQETPIPQTAQAA
jgi:D-threo-aldose 1-dehydrogenase